MNKKKLLLREYLSSFLHLFYPNLCAACKDSLLVNEEFICFSCIHHLPLTNSWSKENNIVFQKFTGRFEFRYASAFLNFTQGGIVQNLMHQIKYNSEKDLAVFLGTLFAEYLKGTSWIKEIDYLIPVPLHPKREKMRGYNQAFLLAKGLEGILKIPILKNNLIRTVNSASQTTKTGLGRLENVKEVFALRNEDILHNKHVLLIDDVLTTGATVESCALTLSAIKQIKISIACLAVVED